MGDQKYQPHSVENGTGTGIPKKFAESDGLQGGWKLAAAYFAAKREKMIFSCNVNFKNHQLQKRYLAAGLTSKT